MHRSDHERRRLRVHIARCSKNIWPGLDGRPNGPDRVSPVPSASFVGRHKNCPSSLQFHKTGLTGRTGQIKSAKISALTPLQGSDSLVETLEEQSRNTNSSGITYHPVQYRGNSVAGHMAGFLDQANDTSSKVHQPD